jgi:hypothetical protein
VWWLLPTALAGKLVPSVLPVPCCTAMTVTGVDAAGLRVGGTVALGFDCTLLGVSREVARGPARYGVVPLPTGPMPSGASVLRPAYEALRSRAEPVDDLLVAVRVEDGWHVWLLRPNEVDVLTVSRAELDRDGVLVRVVDEVRPWSPPPLAEAARTVWSLEGS